MTDRTRRAAPRKNRNMAVKRQPSSRPSATRSQVGFLIVLAVVGTFGLAMLNANQAGGQSVAPVATAAPFAARTLAPTLAAGATSTAPAPAWLLIAKQPAGRPRRIVIGIVAGHWGNDSGSVCPDGVTEQHVNLKIARQVAEKLKAYGYQVDLLQEFDSRLNGYRADVLLSIHADSCDPIDADPPATGFKVARSSASAIPNTEDRLVGCIKEEYAAVTKLPFHANSITRDMTSYHSFAEVNLSTPAAIIETGFLFLDYNLLVHQSNLPAQGIANGIQCFLKSQP
jgi:N-acetylmuramoyl-L-alanine amidase